MVNELDSLQACIYSNKDTDLLPAVEWMVNYWMNEINNAIECQEFKLLC